MRLYIKNMVCDRCIMVVEHELKDMGLKPQSVGLGEILLPIELSNFEKEALNDRLLSLGFELIDDRRSRLIEQIKTLIVKLIHHSNVKLNIHLSEYLTQHIHHDYNYISNIFSEVEGTTIEKYFIAQKIEKVKELLVYDELSLSEIDDRLNYSSVAHISSQFKKVTELTPSHFKKIGIAKRKPLDKV